MLRVRVLLHFVDKDLKMVDVTQLLQEAVFWGFFFKKKKKKEDIFYWTSANNGSRPHVVRAWIPCR
jgi:hypothetical protein